MSNMTARLAFAGFLDRVMAGALTADDWHRYVVTHYADDELEAVRAALVRLTMTVPAPATQADLSTKHRDQLTTWAQSLRVSAV